jgi:dTDP-4-amino-4,6-dideoxygalactose transaminase
VTVPKEASYSTHVYHQYTLLIEEGRDQLQQALTNAGIASGVYYPIPSASSERLTSGTAIK